MRTYLFPLLLLLSGIEVSCVTVEIRCLRIPLLNVVHQRPFLTAAILVVLLQEEPWECIKGTLSYMLEEHPIFCTLMIGLLFSGAYKDLKYYANVINSIVNWIKYVLL